MFHPTGLQWIGFLVLAGIFIARYVQKRNKKRAEEEEHRNEKFFKED